jgi:hypothetical protein
MISKDFFFQSLNAKAQKVVMNRPDVSIVAVLGMFYEIPKNSL